MLARVTEAAIFAAGFCFMAALAQGWVEAAAGFVAIFR